MANALDDQTRETLDAIAKAQTAGITSNTGITSYDLSNLVTLIPVVTPFRDFVARVKSTDGSKFAIWRAIMNTTNSQPDPAIPFDFAANETLFQEQDFQANYKASGLAGMVTQDSYDLALGYDDVYATATFNVLNQVLIGDDRKLIGAQSFALPAATAPTLTQHASGGTIGTGTFYVAVAGRTGSGYFYGSGNSQGAASAGTTFSGGSANSITAVATAQRGAVAYDWFFSSNGTTYFYYSTTTTNTITVTAAITQASALPSATACPDLTTNWKGSAGVPTLNLSADNGSANAADYDGLLASLSGDYNGVGQWVTAGTSTANPSVWNSLGGAGLTLTGGTVNEIQEYLFQPVWTAIKASPTALMMNAYHAQEIANLILGSNSATTFLNTDASGRINVVAGGRVGEIVNAPAGGVTVPIEVHVSLPPGTIIARTDRVPFPQAQISNVLEYRALRDMAQFDYGISRVAGVAGGGPRREFEIRSMGAFVNRAPVSMASLTCVA